MCLTYLHVGGLVAIGFDAASQYVLTASHSGRGVFDTRTWQRVARDSEPAYPEDGMVAGIGPLAGQLLPVTELDYLTERLEVVSPDGVYKLSYAEGMVSVSKAGT
jgi:hypothetical protein